MAVAAIVISRASQQKPIETKEFPNFHPKHYIYRRLGFNCEKMSFVYKIVAKPVKEGHPKFGDIKAFAQHILSNNHSPKNDRRENKPLDVPVREDSYIIFELPEDWSFSGITAAGGLPAVTLGGENPDSERYANLRYVTAGADSDQPLDNCRLVYFSAKKNDGTKTAPYEQPINFNIVMPGGLFVVVDPDVRFPGNGAEQTDPPS
jgi:hypothetical protein